MDIYKITKKDPTAFRASNVRYGTKRRASAVVRQAREDNQSRRDGAAWYSQKLGGDPIVPKIITVTIERAPVGEFTDVTAEFIGEGE